jgi:hypothetical protein
MFTTSFVSPAQGFALGGTCSETTGACRAQVIATTDGGVRWHSVGTLKVLVSSGPPTCGTGAGANTASVSEITFANQSDGWAWGPKLYFTRDGAEKWHVAKLAGSVQALTVVGSQVWAVVTECNDSRVRTNQSLELMKSPVRGGAWSQVAGLPAISASSASLVATTSLQAWLEVTGLSMSGDGTVATLFATSDGGATWSALEDPCVPAPGGKAPPFAAIGESVWIACGGEDGAGSESKTIYTSFDGGRNWSVAGSSGQLGASPGPTPAAIPLGGYILQLTLTSPSVGWMALSLGGLLVSRDSGQTWSAAIPAGAVAGGSGVLVVTFATPNNGWALANSGGVDPNVIYRTVDGGRDWAPFPIK